MTLPGDKKSLRGLNVATVFERLRKISVEQLGVDEGEVVGLIGPNGAGKTTLFNLISAALVPKPGIISTRFLYI